MASSVKVVENTFVWDPELERDMDLKLKLTQDWSHLGFESSFQTIFSAVGKVFIIQNGLVYRKSKNACKGPSETWAIIDKEVIAAFWDTKQIYVVKKDGAVYNQLWTTGEIPEGPIKGPHYWSSFSPTTQCAFVEKRLDKNCFMAYVLHDGVLDSWIWGSPQHALKQRTWSRSDDVRGMWVEDGVLHKVHFQDTGKVEKVGAKVGADVFEEQWFVQWVYGVLQTLKDLGRKNPTSVTVVGVKPDLNQNFITKVEFPELMQRVRAAFAGEKVGFEYDFCSFLECDTRVLGGHLEKLGSNDYIVVASSPRTKMKEVEAMTKDAPNVRIVWAEENDFSNEAAGT